MDDRYDAALVPDLPPAKPLRKSPTDVSTTNTRLVLTLATFGFIALGLCLLWPYIAGAREAAKRTTCMANMRLLGMAVGLHEQARRLYPLVNTSPFDLQTIRPGEARADTNYDGYSWLVSLLPYLECDPKYWAMKKASGRFTQPAFASTVRDETGAHFATHSYRQFRCPSFQGEEVCQADAEYAAFQPAVGNYVALVATDFGPGKNEPGGPVAWKKEYDTWENGAIVSRCVSRDAMTGECNSPGLRLKHMADGISNIFLAAETREQRYGSWYSGVSTWAVGVTRQSSGGANNDGLRANTSFGAISIQEGADPQLSMRWNDGTTGNADRVYLKAGENWTGHRDRLFGPSSDHAGRVVLHVFADAHVRSLSTDVDRVLYLRHITTRSGDGTGPCGGGL